MNSLASLFNNPNIKYNDPFYEIHNPVQSCKNPPDMYEYEDFLNNIDHNAYPTPKDKIFHRIADDAWEEVNRNGGGNR